LVTAIKLAIAMAVLVTAHIKVVLVLVAVLAATIKILDPICEQQQEAMFRWAIFVHLVDK
jgi:hypothetical protein